jgi:hypothetical protein
LTALVIDFAKILLATSRDVLPVIVLITFFHLIVLRQPIPHLRRLVVGCVFVVLGLALFLAGLEKALFPLGKIMAAQLSDPAFIYGSEDAVARADWKAYGWIYLFGAMIGFATTIAEPALIAVARWPSRPVRSLPALSVNGDCASPLQLVSLSASAWAPFELSAVPRSLSIYWPDT